MGCSLSSCQVIADLHSRSVRDTYKFAPDQGQESVISDMTTSDSTVKTLIFDTLFAAVFGEFASIITKNE